VKRSSSFYYELHALRFRSIRYGVAVTAGDSVVRQRPRLRNRVNAFFFGMLRQAKFGRPKPHSPLLLVPYEVYNVRSGEQVRGDGSQP